MLLAIRCLTEFVYVCIPCAVFEIILAFRERNRNPHDSRHFLWKVLLLFYFALVMILTQIGTVWDIGRYPPDIIPPNEVFLVPFHSIPGGLFTDSDNVLLFMPLGLLLPKIWERHRAIWRTAETAFLLSAAIELSQLLNRRITDVDDLIMNVLGAVLGCMLFAVLRRLRGKRSPRTRRGGSFAARHEAGILLALAFAGAFLHNPWAG